ncbi:competence type IV pilus minor pilin ComGD [Lysinibacillus irui]|uniref:Competence type IV pilus minor pilin ComGD n=1 Tax=Lysinibacillus irui TaxID=2998077 RepID=A0AAJ5RJ21_9BACI|nr:MULTISPECIES: competence type IV pilus minor pilin ComGD [Lysinibacillus]WDV05512.1 competence type IV pilus minor pilin ComGD [Lysinibacillus irui]
MIGNKNGGFTLLEILIVLFLIMSLTAIVSKFSFKLAEMKELERFFTQMQLDIQYIQTYSMSQRQYIALKMESSTNRYVIQKDFYTTLYERPFPKGVEFLPAESSIHTLIYNYNGNVMSAGTIAFKTSWGKKKVIITIGRGRARIE